MATTRAQPDRTNAATRSGRDAAHPGTAEFTAPPGDVAGNDGLRRALATMVAKGSYAGRPEWEAIGRQVLTLADRDGWHWLRHASEYQDAYVLAAIEFLRDHPESVVDARNPWGLVVTRGPLRRRMGGGSTKPRADSPTATRSRTMSASQTFPVSYRSTNTVKPARRILETWADPNDGAGTSKHR